MPKLKCSTVQCVGKISLPRPLLRHTRTHTSQLKQLLSLRAQSDSSFKLDKTPFCCESCKNLRVDFGLPIHFRTVTTVTTNLPLIFHPTLLSILDVFHLILGRYTPFTSIKDFFDWLHGGSSAISWHGFKCFNDHFYIFHNSRLVIAADLRKSSILLLATSKLIYPFERGNSQVSIDWIEPLF